VILKHAGPPVRFIIDGLLHYQPVLTQTPKKKGKTIKEGKNQEKEEDDMETNRLHSTDQHGISFINSALCYLMKIEFQRQRPTVEI
jgi:hypothetical protein